MKPLFMTIAAFFTAVTATAAGADTDAHGPAEKPHAATCLSQEACTPFIAFVDPIDAFEGGH